MTDITNLNKRDLKNVNKSKDQQEKITEMFKTGFNMFLSNYGK